MDPASAPSVTRNTKNARSGIAVSGYETTMDVTRLSSNAYVCVTLDSVT